MGKMHKKESKHKVLYTFATGILLLALLVPLAGCQAEAETTTVIEKSTVTSTLSKTETKTVTENATVTETKTVTVSPTATTSTSSTTSTTQVTTETSIIANTQEQKITSADGKLAILKHEWMDSYIITPYGTYVAGVVKNLTDSVLNAEVIVEFYSVDNVLLSTITQVVSNIGAGRSQTFQVWSTDTTRNIHPSKKYIIVGLKVVS
jgi:hypothetical protein